MIAHPGRRIEPHTLHASLIPDEPLTPGQQRQLRADEIKAAALAYVSNRDDRSIREIAAFLGCRRSALHKCITKIREAVGIRSGAITDGQREALRKARRRVLEREKRKGAAANDASSEAQ